MIAPPSLAHFRASGEPAALPARARGRSGQGRRQGGGGRRGARRLGHAAAQGGGGGASDGQAARRAAKRCRRAGRGVRGWEGSPSLGGAGAFSV
eukprot:447665-Pleurochrysis_carterae.AAC.1